ncbi:ErfK/YbiS/YcfS/YnhG family protein [Calothrix sp. NIES-4071]|nr:ErfK/YbiS/YcfS/YnhG family protein [Calothrix sp. NIES-4071]BAZ55358.1 ErfK/YbiS/YcfS/YnhG family protein [Calothrix sp. NIES-4105]
MKVSDRKSLKCKLSLLTVISVLTTFNIATPIAMSAPAPTAVVSKSQLITQKINELKQSQERWIEINLKQQKLTAWEGNKVIYTVPVSTGKKSTPTLTGVYAVQTKLRKARMRGDDYDIPDVPYTMYYDGNYGIHGAYWHNNFGTPVSHGCVNLPPKKAQLIYNWAKVGTPVVVRKS